MEYKKRLGIDLDGTITEDAPVLKNPSYFYLTDEEISEIYLNLKINEDVVIKLNEYREIGWKIYIYTSRDERFRDVSVEWLSKNNVPYDVLIMNKPYFNLYVGDEVQEIKNFINEKIK